MPITTDHKGLITSRAWVLTLNHAMSMCIPCPLGDHTKSLAVTLHMQVRISSTCFNQQGTRCVPVNPGCPSSMVCLCAG